MHALKRALDTNILARCHVHIDGSAQTRVQQDAARRFAGKARCLAFTPPVRLAR